MLLRRSLLLLALAALIAAPGCSRRDGDDPIRLVDLAAGAAIDSAADLAAGGDAFLEGARVLFSGPCASVDAAARARHQGAWIAALLLDGTAAGAGGPLLDLIQVAVKPEQPVLVRVESARDLQPGERLFVLELETSLSAEQLRDSARVEPVLSGSAGFLRSLSPAPGTDGGPARRETVLVSTPRARSFLIGRVFFAQDEPAGALLVAELTARGAWLQASALPGRSPWVRSVSAGRLTRESLVLGAPGRARFQVRVPARRPRLTTAATPLFAERGQTFGAEIQAVGGAGARRLRFFSTLEPDAWTPLELDLASLAGEEAEITLSVAASAGAGAPPLAAFGAPVVDGACDDPRPDVILVSLDTARADRMSLYGFSRETTPRLERLGEGAVVFENAIAPAPWTLPSHVSLFSGQYPDRHGVHGSLSQVDAGTPWLAEAFRAAGYRTAAFTGGGYVHPEFGFARGFESYGFADPATPPLEWARGRGSAALDLQAAEDSARARAALLDLMRGERRGARFLFVHSYAAHSYAAAPDDLLRLGA
ncbi:MAG: sulfatase-like hydrolase/transferase, partial [Planctomycetes bacterium]|nr:sulfatase-like hydrolase/transferase [Planctomycetota bacterium]